jgi:hypothetical protein
VARPGMSSTPGLSPRSFTPNLSAPAD